MAVTTYTGWVADKEPALRAQPIADMQATFEGLGYTVFWYPDQRHLTANPPEDHTPFSHTPWPGTQPYPYVLALDIMPKPGTTAVDMAPLAQAIIADKRAGRADWIKYINWTDADGHVHHTKWQPTEVTTDSSDSGHIHISIRTDYVHSDAAKGWTPVMTTDATVEALMNRTINGVRIADILGREDAFNKQIPGNLADISTKVTALTTAAGTGGIDPAALQSAVNLAVAAALSDETVVAAFATHLIALLPAYAPVKGS